MAKGTRRTFLKASTAGIAAAVVPNAAQAVITTPGSTEGPFYPAPEMRFDDVDNDLVRIEGRVRNSGGEIIRLTGQVLDKNENPVSGARIEIWQCDANGRYLHDRDTRKVEVGSQNYNVILIREAWPNSRTRSFEKLWNFRSCLQPMRPTTKLQGPEQLQFWMTTKNFSVMNC